MAKNWIKGAIKHPGALHRALDVPEGKPIPAAKMKKAMDAGGYMKKMAQLAKTLKSFHKKGGG